MSVNLTKSSYLKGAKCEKYMWLSRHRKDLLKSQSAFELYNIENGKESESYFHEWFDSAVMVPSNLMDKHERILETKKFLDQGEELILEATFEFNNVEVRVDALKRTDDGFEIYEAKSSTWREKKKTKGEYITDVAVQYYVLNGLGMKVIKSYLVLLNSKYEKKESLDLNRLFLPIDISAEVLEMQPSLSDNISNFIRVLSRSNVEPDSNIGSKCKKDKKDCPAKAYCWKGVPGYSVIDIFTLRKNSQAFTLLEQGMVKVEDIPVDTKMTPREEFYVNHWKNKSTATDVNKIEEFLSQLKYPIFHLDFESFSPSVPKYSNSYPYQQIPCQYSVHIEYADGRLEHEEFLTDGKNDPRIELIPQLLADTAGSSSVLVYEERYEKTRISELARDFPQYAEKLNNLNARIVDLAKIFKGSGSQGYYSYKFKSGYTLKRVMPTLIPETDQEYAALSSKYGTGNGQDAICALKTLTSGASGVDVDFLREGLLEYCKLDTLAMVRILAAVRAMI